MKNATTQSFYQEVWGIRAPHWSVSLTVDNMVLSLLVLLHLDTALHRRDNKIKYKPFYARYK